MGNRLLFENTERFQVMHLPCGKYDARFARDARLRRMMCLPLANVKEKRWLKCASTTFLFY